VPLVTLTHEVPMMPSTGIAILGADHGYRWANQAQCALTGWDLTALRALSQSEVTAPDDLDTELAALSPLHAGRCEEVSWRRRFGRYDGVRRWCRVTAHALRDPGGSLHEMVWMVEADAPSTDPLPATLDLVVRRLRGDHECIAATLSHDAVQPTRMISSYAGLIEQRLRGRPAQSELDHLSAIQRASDELRALLRETVAYLRVPERLTAPVRANLRGCAEAVALRLAGEFPGLSLAVLGDLDLAIEIEPLECCLRAALVFAWARSPTGKVEITGSAPPGWKVLEIVAPGAALGEGDTDRLFQLGARITLGDRPGTVLPGLAVARRIVEGAGGAMEIAGSGGAVRITMRFASDS